ncbi:MAG TPA: hypothetical protein V6C78_16525 [Crinalium sp.]|jgi:hypothetical protein
MKHTLFFIIKAISIILITGAIGLESWNRYAAFTSGPFIDVPAFVVWFSRFALISHAIEGVIAASFASAKQKSAFPYGIYTFFVGTVSLVELFESGETPSAESP